MFKKIIILSIILLSLSSCWSNQTNNLNKKDLKEKNIIDNNIQKVEEKWLWIIWGTGKITVSSWFIN